MTKAKTAQVAAIFSQAAAVDLMRQSPAQGPGVIQLGNGRMVAYTSLVSMNEVTPARWLGFKPASHPDGQVMGFLAADKAEASIIMGFDCAVNPAYHAFRNIAHDIRTAAERPLFELARPSKATIPMFGKRTNA